MENVSKIKRNIDVALCLDVTGGMDKFISYFHGATKDFCRLLVEKLEKTFDSVDKINLKLIAFRDYAHDDDAMFESEWFDLRSFGAERFAELVKGIEADGGGDDPESGLEALFYAMTTDWNASAPRDRQIILLLTDADAHPIGEDENYGYYRYCKGEPVDMVDWEGLLKTWYGIPPLFISKEDFKLKERLKRLFVFAPQGTAYEKLCANLNRSRFIPTEECSSLFGLTVEDIINEIF